MAGYTVKNVLNMSPCSDYSEAVITRLFAGKKTITATDVLEMDISMGDKRWAIERMLPWPDGFKYPFTDLRVENNPGLTQLDVPAGVTALWVLNNPGLEKK
ncbi:MAG: hypothetical protein WBN66_03680 [Smithella sp.]